MSFSLFLQLFTTPFVPGQYYIQGVGGCESVDQVVLHCSGVYDPWTLNLPLGTATDHGRIRGPGPHLVTVDLEDIFMPDHEKMIRAKAAVEVNLRVHD